VVDHIIILTPYLGTNFQIIESKNVSLNTVFNVTCWGVTHVVVCLVVFVAIGAQSFQGETLFCCTTSYLYTIYEYRYNFVFYY